MSQGKGTSSLEAAGPASQPGPRFEGGPEAEREAEFAPGPAAGSEPALVLAPDAGADAGAGPEATLVEASAVEAAGAHAPSEGRAGRYRLLEKLGEGSMGEVWRGEDPQIARPVAVKLPNVPRGLADEVRAEWEERFLREARAAGRLSHPGIVPVYDVGRSADGRPFIVMELVEGRSLDVIMEKGPAPPAETALGWGAEVAEALGAAHQRGVVHRDIKPANVLIDASGRARIADFGIARVPESELTREGVFIGSPAFTSPEQLRGDAVDGRSDLFSLASTLYALLTGVRPFRGADLTALAYAICHVEPDPPSRHSPGLPAGCDAVLLKALAKDPGRRHQTGGDLAADLRAAARGERPASRGEPAGGVERTVREAPLPAEGAPPPIGREPAPGDPRRPAADAARDGTAAGRSAPVSAVAQAGSGLPGGREGIERQAAAVGSSAAVLLVRSAATAGAAARAAGKHTMAAARASAPVLGRISRAVAAGAGRTWRAAREAWARGWARGPRVRALMAAGLVLVLAALTAGGIALGRWIAESRRETPGRKMKKAFQSLFSELNGRPGSSAAWESDRRA